MAGQSTDEEKNVFTFLMVQACNIEVPFMVDDTFLVTSFLTYEKGQFKKIGEGILIDIYQVSKL